MINTSVKAINSHHLYLASTEESQSRSPQVDAGSDPTRAHPVLNGLPSIRQGRQATRPDATHTSALERSRRTEVFKAQRQAISMQPGPSKNPHLIALDKLQERDFEPATGGVKIPLGPNSLPGGGKRVQVVGTSSRDIHVVPAGILPELRDQIVDKQEFIRVISEELQQARNERNPTMIAQNQQLLEQATSELMTLLERAAAYGEQSRRIRRV